ncbi:hypothetical protein FRC00_008677 [Tulasnella sp. 408]|nr:hypothetical protein FRC00_008677 [Tulasnella sp. 408]
MSRGGFGNKSSLEVASSQSVQTPSPISSPTQSTSSISSQETIKALRFSTKAILKELVGGGGNNRSVPKLPKSERIYTSGRGGARKGPKSLSYIGPSNAEKLDALLSNSNREPECLASEIATVSSCAASHSGSLESGHSKATVKQAVKEVLGEDEEDTSSSWSIAQAYLARPNDYLVGAAHHDLAAPNRFLEDNTDDHQPGPACLLESLVQNQHQAGFAENGRGRAMSEGAEAVHSPQLVHFRRSLQAERQRKEGSRAAERTLRERAFGTKQNIEHKAPAGTFTSRPLGHVSPPPSHRPPSLPPTASIRYSYKGSSGRPADRGAAVLPTQLPPPTLSEMELEQDLRLHAVGRSLASALALVQARSEHIRNMETPVASCSAQLGREHQELRREREMLAARLQSMKKEILQHEKTIEGLTWLVSNLPEHQGRQIVVDTGDSEIDEATMLMMREAEEELMNGESRSILDLERYPDPEEPALPDSPRGVEPVL